MGKKVVAVLGSYRRGGITEQAVDAMLEAVRQKGGEAVKINLLDKRIEFCTNCRKCTADTQALRRGVCVFNDDMAGVLDAIDEADGLILAAPYNFGSVTAIMKRFVERFVMYAYWPWEAKGPAGRIKEKNKKAVLVTSSTAPAFIAKMMWRGGTKSMKMAAQVTGARVVKTIHFGMVNRSEHQKLSEKERTKAQAAAAKL